MTAMKNKSGDDDALSMERLRNAEAEADRFGPVSIAQIRKLAMSRSPVERLLAIKLMDREIYAGKADPAYFSIGESLIGDGDNTCRWQALILVGEFLTECPDDIWRIVEKYGQSEEEDMRAGVACVLLEHLLEHFRDRYKERAEELARVSTSFAHTLSMSWGFCH